MTATPEGALIRVARKARGLSVKKAIELLREQAPDVRLGESRWYHIEGGTEGKNQPVVAPDDTLAHMAYVVGLTPDRLVSVGREGAAEILEEIHRQMDAGARRDETPVDPALRRLMELWPSLREWQRQSLVGIAREMTSDLAGP